MASPDLYSLVIAGLVSRVGSILRGYHYTCVFVIVVALGGLEFYFNCLQVINIPIFEVVQGVRNLKVYFYED